MTSDLISIKTSAPGKVILFGEHSVVYGKLAVAASLGLRTRFKLSESVVKNSSFLTIHLPVFHSNYSINLQELFKKFENLHTFHTNWAQPDLINFEAFVKQIESFLSTVTSHNFSKSELLSWKCYLFLFLVILAPANIEFPSLDLTVETDLSVGAGTGSSASFAVCASAAFLEYLKHKSQNCASVAKNGFESLVLPKDVCLGKFSKFELDLISKWAFCSEKIIHGTPSGLDNTICTFGNLVEFRKGQAPKSIQLFKKFQILLVNTKISRETHVYVLKVRNLYNKHTQITENLLSACENVVFDAIKTILQIDKEEDVDSTDFYDELNNLSAINHNILNALGVGHSKLDQIVSILKDFGLSAKLTGAGGGGYAYCFIPPFVKRRVVDEATKLLENNGFEVKLCDLGGEGVRVD